MPTAIGGCWSGRKDMRPAVRAIRAGPAEPAGITNRQMGIRIRYSTR